VIRRSPALRSRRPNSSEYHSGSRRHRCAAPRAGDSARPPALGRPRPARAGPHTLCPPLVYWIYPATQTGIADAVFFGGPLSRSRPPCRGRSLWSRRMRSASPNLDTAATRKGPGACAEDGKEGRTLRLPPMAGPSLHGLRSGLAQLVARLEADGLVPHCHGVGVHRPVPAVRDLRSSEPGEQLRPRGLRHRYLGTAHPPR
jgi:hypothetical protein